MTEQLSMFSNDSPTGAIASDQSIPVNPDVIVDAEYDALDYQLADLMIDLNDYKAEDAAQKKLLNKTLRDYTLDISKRTREGQIAIAIPTDQQTLILQSTVVGIAGDYMPLIIADGYLYLNRYWQYQKRLADQINRRIQSQATLTETQQAWLQSRLDDYFPKLDDSTEINWQKRAAELALINNFLIVSGGPGTGKTTTITRLLALLIEQHILLSSNDASKALANSADIMIRQSPHPKGPAKAVVSQSSAELDVSKNETASSLKKRGGVFSDSFKILLAAPTGKAAVRMLDSMREASNSLKTELNIDDNVLSQLPSEANTIHKLLGYQHNSVQFKHNRNNPLNADVVLVDEASMIDIALMSKLVEAIPLHAKLILIGDKDQLASVETGSVYADICEGLSASDHLVTLKKNWRFDANSDIGQCAIAANQGDSQTLLSILNDPNRIQAERIAPANLRDANLINPWRQYFKVVNNPDSTLAEIFAAFNQYRILTALRRGFNGSEIMNDRIEVALEKHDLIKRLRGSNQQQSSWYNGRPIMIAQNSYNRGLFNGDTGITLIREGEIKVWFPMSDSSWADGSAEFKSFSPIRLPAHETTWAMTIHKSQGSEFNQVVLILPQEEMPLLTRQLVYTGITRAKESVSIVASEEVLMTGIKAKVVKATRLDHQLESG